MLGRKPSARELYLRVEPEPDILIGAMRRREFLRQSAGLAVTLGSWPLLGRASEFGNPKLAADRILLGPHRLPVTRLAVGTGTNGWGGRSDQTSLGMAGLADLLHYSYDRGVRFWDSADQYGSHPHVREGLQRVSRENVFVLTKTRAVTAQQMRQDLDRFRRELGTDYIDILLLHCMTDGDWPSKFRGAMDVISEAKVRGVVKTHGVSCHTLEALQAAAREPWVEVDLARINPAGASMDADPQVVLPILRQMKASGKGVIGMKIFGAGRLADRPGECLLFALKQDCIDCFTIGVQSRAQMDDLLKRIQACSVAA
jgi:predicted aldo/keto reductase-like oxidoreductase